VPIQWTDDLLIGIAKIDAQHRELYRAVASLHEAVRQQRLDEVPVTLEFLDSYIAEHFAEEEEEMAQASYPALERHRAIHRAFVEEFTRFRDRFEAEGVSPPLVVELSHRLVDWLRDHVRRIDGEMGRYLRAWRAAAHDLGALGAPRLATAPAPDPSRAAGGTSRRK
jgi:hemerythrin